MSGNSERLPAVGFVGLGRMGVRMAANLAGAGYRLSLWNRTPAKAHALAARLGARACDSLGALAASSSVVVSMVSDGEALEDVYFGAGGIAHNFAGGIALDMSTTGPACARRLERRLAEHDIRFLEAPVSGSVAAADTATLTIMAGGPEALLDELRPLLESLGRPLLHLGPVGAASLAKLMINSLIFSANESLAEALVLAEHGGIDRMLAYDTILQSAAAAPVMRYRRSAFLDAGEPVSFSLALADKDLDLIAETARGLGSPMPQMELNRQTVKHAIAAGLADADLASVAQYLREEPVH